MRNATVTIDGEAVPAVLSIPASGSGPGVIVIQEWWGLVPHIADLTARLAAEGFVALAVDHYRGEETTEPDEAMKLMIGLDIEQVERDLAAAAADLVGRPEVTSDVVGVVGFCMGGGLALLGPAASDSIGGAVAFYPTMPWPTYSPDWARYAGKSAVVHKAESDEPGTGASIAAYAEAIVAAGGDVAIYDYAGSVHAFFNDTRPEVFQADHAALAWERTLAALRAITG